MSGIIPILIPTPFPAGPVNAYLIGTPPYLVDCGVDDDRARAVLSRELKQAGVNPGDLAGVVVTHAHPDHAGLAGWIARRFGVCVYAHPQDIPNLEFGTDYLARRRLLLTQAGLPADRLDSLMRLSFSARGYIHPVADHAKPVPDEIAGNWRVIHTPGHTDGHVCLYEPESQTLLSGDCLLRGVTPAPGLEAAPGNTSRSHLVAFERSMRLLESLDVQCVYPGHGRPFSGHREQIERWREHRRRRELRFVDALGDGRATAYELTMRVYEPADDRALLLAAADTAAHLESLRERGLIAGTGAGGVVVYQGLKGGDS